MGCNKNPQGLATTRMAARPSRFPAAGPAAPWTQYTWVTTASLQWRSSYWYVSPGDAGLSFSGIPNSVITFSVPDLSPADSRHPRQAWRSVPTGTGPPETTARTDAESRSTWLSSPERGDGQETPQNDAL